MEDSSCLSACRALCRKKESAGLRAHGDRSQMATFQHTPSHPDVKLQWMQYTKVIMHQIPEDAIGF